MHEYLHLLLDNSRANTWVSYEINAAEMTNAQSEAHRSTEPALHVNPLSHCFTGPACSVTASFTLRDAA
jgi:hypothetical protein